MTEKRILIPTDAELKQMEDDPNYVGNGRIIHEIKAKYKFVELTCVYHGDASNALNPENHHRHAIKIRRRDKKNSVIVPYWPPFMGKITNEKELLSALLRILSGSVWGAHTPDDFCRKMNIDPDTKRAEVTYHMYHNTYEQIMKILDLDDIGKLMSQLNKSGVR